MNNAGFLSIESVRENQLANLSKQIDNLKEERNRLNNIINELEEYLNKVIETSTEQERVTCSFVLQYLQKLKGSDKE